MNKCIAFLLFLYLGTACTTTVKLSEADTKHIVALKKDGYTYDIDIIDGEDSVLGSGYEATKNYTQGIVDSYAESDIDTMLIFIHGGLNDINTSIGRAVGSDSTARLIDKIMLETDYYPVFLNWESGGFKTTWHQVTRVRRGVESGTVASIFSTLIYLPTQLAIMAVKAPYVAAKDAYLGIFHNNVPKNSEVRRLNESFADPEVNNTGHIYLGYSKKHYFPENTYRNATYIVPGPAKIITGPIISQFGKIAWDNMLRRTQIVFDAPLSHHRYTKLPESSQYYEERRGGFNIFIHQLKEHFRKDGEASSKRIILVGHSMGTIVIAELLKRHPDLPIDDIVFMASAATINDFNESVVPFLQTHRSTSFYNLTLHPIAERRENVFYDLTPRGSLLEWIDRYFNEPKTFNDLTVGKWINAVSAFKDLPQDVRAQVFLKGFGTEESNCLPLKFRSEYQCPTEHGNFSLLPFWDRILWQIPKTN